ncbi:MAG: hypothetical protein ABI740_08705 [Alphaproteobacteria bacterium]
MPILVRSVLSASAGAMLALALAASAQPPAETPDRAGRSCSWLAADGFKISDAESEHRDLRLMIDFDDTLYIDGRVGKVADIKPLIARETATLGAPPVISIEPHWRSTRKAATQVAKAVNEAGEIPICLASS